MCWPSRVVEMSKHNLDIGQELTIQISLGVHHRPFGSQVGQRHFVD